MQKSPVAPRPPVHTEPRPHWLHHSGHFVDFSSLENPMRWLARSAAAITLLALLVLVLPLAHMPAVPLPGMHTRVPAVVLWVGAAVQMLGWWYLLAGSMLSATPIRWLTVAIFVAVQYVWALTPLFAIPTTLLALVFAVLTQRRRLTDRAVIVAAGCIAALSYAIPAAAGPVSISLYSLAQVVTFYILFVPIFFFSGVDLGETGLFITRLALWHLHPRISAMALWWVAMAVLAAKTAFFIFDWQPQGFALLLALAVLVLGGLAAHWLRGHSEPPVLLVLLFSLLAFDVLLRGWPALLALAAGVVVALLSLRRRHLATSAVFLILFGLWNVATSLNAASPGLFHLPGTAVTVRSLDEAVTLVALVYLVFHRVRGTLRVERIMLGIFWLLSFTLLLATTYILESVRTLSSGFIAASALLLVIAIAHEIAASGHLLNHGTPGVPRTARILLFLGYAMLLSGGTLLANGATGAFAHPVDTDVAQAAGLVILGVPIFLQQFLHAFVTGYQAERAADGPAAMAGRQESPAPGS